MAILPHPGEGNVWWWSELMDNFEPHKYLYSVKRRENEKAEIWAGHSTLS